jgi:hypothetical protein
MQGIGIPEKNSKDIALITATDDAINKFEIMLNSINPISIE